MVYCTPYSLCRLFRCFVSFFPQGRPGDETATAYAVPILERVLERCSPEAPRREGDVQLQALVLTRTRDMAANVSVRRVSTPCTGVFSRPVVWV